MIKKPEEMIEFTYVCTFCDSKVKESNLAYTEDYEPSHKQCLESFENHWDEREEALDLLGW
jgi:hypothetical protein